MTKTFTNIANIFPRLQIFSHEFNYYLWWCLEIFWLMSHISSLLTTACLTLPRPQVNARNLDTNKNNIFFLLCTKPFWLTIFPQLQLFSHNSNYFPRLQLFSHDCNYFLTIATIFQRLQLFSHNCNYFPTNTIIFQQFRGFITLENFWWYYQLPAAYWTFLSLCSSPESLCTPVGWYT